MAGRHHDEQVGAFARSKGLLYRLDKLHLANRHLNVKANPMEPGRLDFWQPLRKAVENSLVLKDWFELFIAQNFVLDTLVYELAHNHFDQFMSERGVQSASMLTEIFRTWFADRDRWVTAVIKRAVNESEENKTLISSWIDEWAEQAKPAIVELADYAMPDKSGEITTACMDELDRKKSAIGF